MLSASNISKGYGDRVLFRGLTLNIAPGDRIALIGPNGSGKTTLLDILAGTASPDSGSVSRDRGSTIGYLRQEVSQGSGNTLLQEVVDASPDVTALSNRIAATRESLALESDPDG